ncbi:MAG TPA: VWA domain-containing protein [Terracidiphilus sp.]|jgi:VWFA-related protein
MRRLILIGLMAALVLPADAAKRLTVASLEQLLAADAASHRSDADVAHRLRDLELSERLTDATLDRFANNLPLGPRTALALQLLADESAFLEPPASELPATGTPDAATQERMMDLARGYVVRIWPHLPNFFVTRSTTRFDDSPQVFKQGEWPVRAGLHPVAIVTHKLTYRDGKDIIDQGTGQVPVAATAGKNGAPAAVQQERGMASRGDFGPELTIVLTDSAKGKVAWSHWEQTSAGLAAVYNYSVPKAFSHFEVSYCCIRQGEQRELHYGNSIATRQADEKFFQVTPGYHGTLSVAPDTGAILRITIEAELKFDDPIAKAATMVQYGPVKIGGRTFIFPVRSMAISVEKPDPNSQPDAPSTLLLNQTTFTDYHRLGATIRMFANTPAKGTAGSSTSSSIPPSPAMPSSAPAQLAKKSAATSAAAAEILPPPVPTPAEPVDPEISVSAANAVPDEPARAAEPKQGDIQLKLTSRLVEVGIVAWDKKGHPVKDLKQDDFEVYDNGHKQDLRFFTQFSAGASAAVAEPAANRSFSNRAPDAATAHSNNAGATVLLIDESHIAWPDMANAKREILKFLGTVAPSERVGIYTMTGLGFRVLQEITTDHAQITEKLTKWMPTARSAALAQEEETRNRQTIDEVHSVTDLNSVNGNSIQAPIGMESVDPVLRTMGDNPGRASLIILRQVARHLSAITGHKNLVWVSSDNVFADWQSNQVGIDKTPKEVESFAQHAQEAMNEAHVAVYPMDVSQLETSAIGADIRTQNVELTQAAADTAQLAKQNAGGKADSQVTAELHNQHGGRNTAEMQQDIHPIQGPIRMVADATGGRIIRRTSDLAGALNSVVEDGNATYMVSFSPQGPADDQYHNIRVKLTGQHKGITLRYRTGYLYSKEPVSLKDRFQQAVWRPQDVSEIAVSADTAPKSLGAAIKLDIMAADLGLQQRDGFWMDKLDIFMIQRDDAGIKAQVEGQTLGLRLKPATYQSLLSSGVPFEYVVQMRPGMGSLRVLVVDENSGRMGSVTIPAPALQATP